MEREEEEEDGINGKVGGKMERDVEEDRWKGSRTERMTIKGDKLRR